MKTETSENKIKILIVEDQDHLRESIAEILEANEYNVHTAVNGKQGLLMALDIVPEIIISDIMMPEMDGYQLLENIRKSKLGNIPFLFLTAKTDHQDYRHGMKLGADDYLFKPFKADELLEAVAVRIERRKKLLQEIEGKTRLLKQKLSSLQNHEVNTPLNGILGFSEMLLENLNELSEKDTVDMLKIIQRSGQRLDRVFKKYKFYEEIQGGTDALYISYKGPSVKTPSKIVYETAILKSEEYFREKDLKISCASKSELHIQEELFSFLVYEIIDNCFKFSAAGDAVEVSCVTEEEWFIMRFRDDGRGMSDDEINSIDAYKQFKRSIFEQQGVGLGLYLCKKIISNENGFIRIEKSEEKGLQIEVKLKTKV